MTGIPFKNKLIVKLLGAVAVSFFVAFCVMTLISYFYNVKYIIGADIVKHNLLMLLMFSVVISAFIISLLLMVRKKIIYLKRIAETVHEIANGKLGLTIQVEGKDELSLLAQNLNYMSKELENTFEHERRVESQKNELITNVSHDLRTPLTSIIGYVDLLRRHQYANKKESQDYFDTIYIKSQRLKYLIDELFEYTRLSSPEVKLNPRKVDLAKLLEQMAGEYVPIFEKEQLHLLKSIGRDEVPVLIDVEKMVRVYDNLFSNAIKYSLKPSELKINLYSRNQKAVLKISNKVKTPPLDDTNKLFERFYRQDKARSEHEGTGLGLAISKRIVELHHGDIQAKYRNGWITFIVEHALLDHKGIEDS